MSTHEWRKYDLEKAQIKTAVFEVNNGMVQITQEAMEEILLLLGYKPAEDFDLNIDKYKIG